MAVAAHILFVLVDDLGWANTGFNQPVVPGEPTPAFVTPRIDALLGEGLRLDRHYAYKICSPSRSSLQSGRLPVHVNDVNAGPESVNPADPVAGYAGIPVNMTGIAQKLRAAGFRTHMTGKWDAGMATPRHTPIGRGYETWLGYFHHANDYFTKGLGIEATGEVNVCGNRFTDFWHTDGPATDIPGWQNVYEEELFTNHSLAVIEAHNTSERLFLLHAFHIVHTPLQVPQKWLERFAYVQDSDRRSYAAMVAFMDNEVGKLVDKLVVKRMWDSTLMIFSSDNGGPLYWPAGANNYPLRGGKFSDWEGGVRTVAFVSGGALPAARRGASSDELIHIADWYATFCALAGVSAADPEAEAAGLPAVDGVDQWPMLSLGASSPRSEVWLSTTALISGRYKLLAGVQPMTLWTSPSYPNNSFSGPNFLDKSCEGLSASSKYCHDCDATPCLFDIFDDPNERVNLASTKPALLQQLSDRLAALNRTHFSPDRGSGDKRACDVARTTYGGFYGPFLGV